jgi:hypothetical protein
VVSKKGRDISALHNTPATSQPTAWQSLSVGIFKRNHSAFVNMKKSRFTEEQIVAILRTVLTVLPDLYIYPDRIADALRKFKSNPVKEPKEDDSRMTKDCLKSTNAG